MTTGAFYIFSFNLQIYKFFQYNIEITFIKLTAQIDDGSNIVAYTMYK